MTQENQELKPEATAPESQQEELKQNLDAPQDNQEEKPEQVDYKAELEKAQAERDNYKEGMLNAKEELKSKKNTKSEDLDEKINSLVEEKLNKIQLDSRSDSVSEAVSQISSNEDEQKLILHHYNNSLQKTGFNKSQILADMKKAKLLANESSLYKENSELKEALKSKGATSNTGQGSNLDKPTGENYTLNPQEKVLFDRINARRATNKQKPLSIKEFFNK